MEWASRTLGEELSGPASDVFGSGVRLCQLANKLKPNAIPRVQTGPQAFKKKENLGQFLRFCTASGVADSDLFDPQALLQGAADDAVVRCLAALQAALSPSSAPSTTRPGPPMPPPRAGPPAPPPRVMPPGPGMPPPMPGSTPPGPGMPPPMPGSTPPGPPAGFPKSPILSPPSNLNTSPPGSGMVSPRHSTVSNASSGMSSSSRTGSFSVASSFGGSGFGSSNLSMRTVPGSSKRLTMQDALGDIQAELQKLLVAQAEQHGRRASSVGQRPQIPASGLSARDACVQELIDTEASYTKDMAMISQNLKPLAKMNIMSVAQIKTIFSNLHELVSLGRELGEALSRETATGTVGDWKVGDCFATYGERFMVYSMYCVNFPTAQSALTELIDSDSKVRSYFDTELAKSGYRGMDIHDFLIKPVQRICKYPLLFREILKHTPSEHPDLDGCTQALNKFLEVASALNDARREAENTQKIAELQTGIEGLDIKLTEIEGLRLVREETAMKLSKGNDQERHFFLFSQFILYAKIKSLKKRRFELKGRISMAHVSYRDLPDTGSTKNAFEIERADKDKNATYRIAFKTSEAKKAFLEDLASLMAEYKASGAQPPSGITDAVSSWGSPPPSRGGSISENAPPPSLARSSSMPMGGGSFIAPTPPPSVSPSVSSSLRDFASDPTLSMTKSVRRDSRPTPPGSDDLRDQVKELYAMVHHLQQQLEAEQSKRAALERRVHEMESQSTSTASARF